MTYIAFGRKLSEDEESVSLTWCVTTTSAKPPYEFSCFHKSKLRFLCLYGIHGRLSILGRHFHVEVYFCILWLSKYILITSVLYIYIMKHDGWCAAHLMRMGVHIYTYELSLNFTGSFLKFLFYPLFYKLKILIFFHTNNYSTK